MSAKAKRGEQVKEFATTPDRLAWFKGFKQTDQEKEEYTGSWTDILRPNSKQCSMWPGKPHHPTRNHLTRRCGRVWQKMGICPA